MTVEFLAPHSSLEPTDTSSSQGDYCLIGVFHGARTNRRGLNATTVLLSRPRLEQSVTNSSAHFIGFPCAQRRSSISFGCEMSRVSNSVEVEIEVAGRANP